MLLIVTALGIGHYVTRPKEFNPNPRYRIGQEIDRFNDVPVYYNGMVEHCAERTLAPDGYNIGLKHQCVEFVKRYYYEHLHHKMPDSYGHAREFFDPAIADGAYNPKRDLLQFTNGSKSQPKADDLLIIGPSPTNSYGHVAIVASVTDTEVVIVQQNPGPFAPSREPYAIKLDNGLWKYENARVLGWLRKEQKPAATSQ